MAGRLCRVEALDPGQHAKELYDAYGDDREGRNWTYFWYGPFQDFAMERWRYPDNFDERGRQRRALSEM